MKKWKQLSSQIVYNSPHLTLRKDIVELPTGKQKEWTYWDSRDSAMVVGVTTEKKLIMIKQYRYMVDDEVIEFPSGWLEGNEDSATAARREFEEETGYSCNELISLGAYYETYGQLNRQIHIYFSPNVTKSKQHLDEGEKGYEDIVVELNNIEDVVNLAMENKIAAMGSSLAIMLLQEKIERGEIEL